MESAKTQKLSLNDFDAVEPVPTSLRKTEEPAAEFKSFQGEEKSSEFTLPSNFWDWLQADPELKAELDRRNAVRMQAEIDRRIASLEETVKAEAWKQGFAEGVEKGQAATRESQAELGRICQTLLANREAVIRDHEREWAEAFSHLLKRFLIAPKLQASHIAAWLRESIQILGRDARVRISVGSELYAIVKDIQQSEGETRWEVALDTLLPARDIRCETDKGGAIFSSEAQLKKLEEMLQNA